MRKIGHFVTGIHVEGKSGRFGNIYNPSTGEKLAEVSIANREEVNNAVSQAKEHQQEWAQINPQNRARVFTEFVRLVNKEKKALAELLSSEHGKIVADSLGDIQRGIEVMEFVCGAPHLLKGEFNSNVGSGIDMYSLRQPLGVVAGITPFNFPAMIPLWKLGPALACGNAFILKPSEKDPSVPMRLAELMIEAGLPKGVFNVINGDKEAVDALLEHPDVSAIGFVGSTPIARYVYSQACANGKRAQCFGGAKNHMVIMPDADIEQAANALIGAAYGSAGERCMAISVAVPVGQKTAEALREKLIPKIEKLTIGTAVDEAADYGPVISKEHLEKIRGYIDIGIEEGADLIVDGRDFRLNGYENGYYMGSCLFDNVTTRMRIYKEEIFGPVLCITRADNYEDAVNIVNGCDFGNGTSIYTRDGDTARDFSSRIMIGMVGINVPIPVPLAYYSFGGWKASSFGDLNQHGPDSIRFYSRLKTITSRWPHGKKEQAAFTLPVMD